MNDQPIAFFDSGLGGIPYLDWAAKQLPDEQFVYLADTRNFPYGEKTPEFLRGAVVEQVGRLIAAEHPKAVVVACNTASVVALDALRKRYEVPFIGVVPAVKPAAHVTRNKRIGIFATARTVKDEYTDRLVRDFASDCEVLRVGAPELVRFVEHRFFFASAEELSDVVTRAVAPLKASSVDTVVLACTHFVYLSREIAGALGDGVRVLDSREGVVRQLIRVIDQKGLRAQSRAQLHGRNRFFVSGFGPDGSEISIGDYRTFAAQFNLEYCGDLGRSDKPCDTIGGLKESV